MLKSFSIKNFVAMPDLTVPFEFAEAKAPSGYQREHYHFFIEHPKKVRLVPMLALAGDKNAQRLPFTALETLKALMLNDNELAELYTPDTKNKPIRFELSFYLDNELVTYSIAYNKKQILSESLDKGKSILYSLSNGQENLTGLVTDGDFSKPQIDDIFASYMDARKQMTSFLSRLFLSNPMPNSFIVKLADWVRHKLLIIDINDVVAAKKFEFLDVDDLDETLSEVEPMLQSIK